MSRSNTSMHKSEKHSTKPTKKVEPVKEQRKASKTPERIVKKPSTPPAKPVQKAI